MSIRETAMTRWYWEQRGGTLIEEFLLVRRAPGVARRLIDGLVVLDEEEPRLLDKASSIDITGKDVVAIQTKNARLGMYLMGQTLFTAKLLETLRPRTIESVALCAADDDVLRPLIEAYPGCRVVVCPSEVCELRVRSK